MWISLVRHRRTNACFHVRDKQLSFPCYCYERVHWSPVEWSLWFKGDLINAAEDEMAFHNSKNWKFPLTLDGRSKPGRTVISWSWSFRSPKRMLRNLIAHVSSAVVTRSNCILSWSSFSRSLWITCPNWLTPKLVIPLPCRIATIVSKHK